VACHTLLAREDHIDVVVGQDKAASACLGGYLDRNRARTRRQNRGHVTRARAPDKPRLYEFCGLDWLAGGKGDACNGTGIFVNGVGVLAPEDKSCASRRSWPCLPRQVLRL